MIVDRYDPVNLSELVPKLSLEMEPKLVELDRILEGDELFRRVRVDLLRRYPSTATLGRHSTPVKVILRMLIVRRLYDWSYEETEHFVSGSLVLRQFCRLYLETAPVRLGEIVAGNYLSYGILTLAASAALVYAVRWALDVPLLGPLPLFWLRIGLLLFASLGIGFVISLVAANEQIAAQMAMIVLLASIFLGGFIRPLETLTAPVQVVSHLLPATYGMQALQSVMLRDKQATPSTTLPSRSLGWWL